jgi:hypothetical protein
MNSDTQDKLLSRAWELLNHQREHDNLLRKKHADNLVQVEMRRKFKVLHEQGRTPEQIVTDLLSSKGLTPEQIAEKMKDALVVLDGWIKQLKAGTLDLDDSDLSPDDLLLAQTEEQWNENFSTDLLEGFERSIQVLARITV